MKTFSVCGVEGHNSRSHGVDEQRIVDIFDHLVGEPSDAFLRERAGYLYRSTMWQMVTPWSKPAAVSGEIECGTVRGGGACARGEDEPR